MLPGGQFRMMDPLRILVENMQATMQIEEEIKTILISNLGLSESQFAKGAQTPLLGSIPSLDSLGIVNVLTAIEEQFGIVVSDEDINGAIFSNLGTLTAYVHSKLD